MISTFLRLPKRILVHCGIALFFLLVLAACSSDNQEALSLTTMPPGDASRGAELFSQSINGAPVCTTCHKLDDTTLVGPSLQGFAARAATRISGKSPSEYTLQSIMHPASFIVPGFSNVMYAEYATRLTPQQISDLVAYLLTL